MNAVLQEAQEISTFGVFLRTARKFFLDGLNVLFFREACNGEASRKMVLLHTSENLSRDMGLAHENHEHTPLYEVQTFDINTFKVLELIEQFTERDPQARITVVYRPQNQQDETSICGVFEIRIFLQNNKHLTLCELYTLISKTSNDFNFS